jgi:transposase InsO family protein
VFQVSQRVACRAVGQHRSTQRYQAKDQAQADPDSGLREWLRAYAKAHPRWGWRRAYHDARADSWVVNHKKLQRLWRDEGLKVVYKHRRKHIGATTEGLDPRAGSPDDVLAIDFQFDTTSDGQPIKILSIIDEYTRENVGGLVERSITSLKLADELDRIVAVRGKAPRVLRLDNGPEMISQALADWAEGRTGMCFIPPGEPWKNGYIESFNARMRDECLNINAFWSLAHAQVVISDWRHEYNHHRRHSALGYKTPAQYATEQRETTRLSN